MRLGEPGEPQSDKGRSVGEIADASRTIYRSLGEADRETFQHLRALRTQLAALSLRGPGPLSPADYQARLRDLETQGDTLIPPPCPAAASLPADVITRVAAALPMLMKLRRQAMGEGGLAAVPAHMRCA
jgi:hypothetical protein